MYQHATFGLKSLLQNVMTTVTCFLMWTDRVTDI